MSTDLTTFLEKDNFEHGMRIASTLAKSNIVPASIRGKTDDIFAILAMGAEIGIKPMQALNSINVIQGKATIPPQLMMAMVYGKLPGAIIDIKQNEAAKNVTCKTARSKEHLDAGLYYEAVWDMPRAERMGLTIKDNYQKQAKTMLTWRSVAESCRMTFPDIIMGLYVPEEFQDTDGSVLKAPITRYESNDMMDADFPIPEEEKIVGDNYRVQNGKFRGKQLKDIDLEEIADFREVLVMRTTPKKDWELELIRVFTEYLRMNEPAIQA